MLALILILLPNKRTLFARKTDDDVKEIINQVRKILQSPQVAYFVQVIYGVNLKLTADNAMEISTNLTTDARGTSQLVGMGIGGSITGKHFDFIFTDDIVNMKDRKSKAERERTKLIYQELLNIRNPGGRIINTGTPWHVEDAFCLMPEAEKYDCYSTGLLSREEIEALRQSMAPSLFAANYELRHIAAEGALFTAAPVFITKAMAEEILGEGAKPEDLLRDGKAHIDAAYDGEDYTAFTCGRRRGDTLYMYGRMWRAHVDTVLGVCISKANELMCAPIHTETNGDKGYLAKEIKNAGATAYAYSEKENKYIKISTFLRKWWPNIRWLEGTDPDYINQILNYTEDAEHDDACLAGDTLIATATGDKAIKDIRAGEYVVTPAGLRRVLFAGVTGYRETNRYNGLVATPNHKIFDATSGAFTRADSLTCACSYSIISLKEMISWRKRLLSSTAKRMSEIQRADITLSARQKTANENAHSSCIGPYGNTTGEKSRTGITFTMLMVMSIITTSAIWSAYRLGSIFRNIRKRITRIRNTGERMLKACYQRAKNQRHGTSQKTGDNFTENTQKIRYAKRTSKYMKRNASSVENLTQGQSSSGIVAKAARRKQGGDGLGLNLNHAKEFARHAVKNSQHITSCTSFATHNASCGFMPVYNLTVEKAGCYFANGILVSNCDSAACVCRILDRHAGEDYHSPFETGRGERSLYAYRG